MSIETKICHTHPLPELSHRAVFIQDDAELKQGHCIYESMVSAVGKVDQTYIGLSNPDWKSC